MYRPSRRHVLGLLAASALALPARVRAADQAAVIEAAKREGQLNLANSASAADFPRFLQAFSARYPFLDASGGLYSAPAGRVLARVEAEMKAGALSFDVMHVANLAAYLDMVQRGQLEAYRSPELASYPPEAQGSDQWAIARVVGVIMAYNSNTLPAALVPKAWTDLLRPEFKGRKLVIQDAAAGTCFNQMYLLEKKLGTDFLKKLGQQQPVIVPTAAQLIDLLVRGEAMVGATVDHFRAFEAPAVKAGIVGVYPEEGMPVASVPIAILKGAPHPNAARLFVDFMLSKEGQTLLNTEIFGVYSMRRDVPPPPGQRPLADTMPLFPQDLADYQRAARRFPETFDRFFKA